MRKEVCIGATYAKMQDLRKNVLAWPVPHINEIVPSREKPGENYAWHCPTTLLIIYGGHYSIFNFKVHYCSTEYTSVVVVSRSSLKMHCPKNILFSFSFTAIKRFLQQ